MLENLRAMAVFAAVVQRGSFSGAARQLGITTSAVSQQIRALEQELGVVLLHRSTRKLSLTEGGNALYQNCLEMVQAAERGRLRINELRNDIVGELRIATTPELGADHIIPALSNWMMAHSQLKVTFEADNRYIDLIDERIDVAIRMSSVPPESSVDARPLARVDQIICATPQYLRQYGVPQHPEDLREMELVAISLMREPEQMDFRQAKSRQTASVKVPMRMCTNNVYLAKTLALNSHGILRVLYLDVQKELANGDLVELLPQWKLPDFTLYAVTLCREQQPLKIQRCLETLAQYFSQLPGGRSI